MARTHRTAPDVDAPLLAPLGIRPATEAVYRVIIDTHEMPVGDGLSPAVRQLLAAGLVEIHDDVVTAVPARVAVERWVAQQEAHIQQARLAASYFAGLQHSLSESFLELVHGREAARELFGHVQTSATRTLRCLDRDPYLQAPRAMISPQQPEVSRRGVTYRVLYHSEVAENPAMLRVIRDSLEIGEEARVYHSVPMRMIICDDAMALLILPFDSHDNDSLDVDALLVHPSTLLDALIQLFEALWGLGSPIGTAELGQGDADRRLLGLLATGLTDASIAREFGVSERTVHRRITRLHERFGTSTRFQLGVRAAQQSMI